MPRSSLEYAKVDNNLVIKLVKHPKITITFDSTMACTYWGKRWLLERFVEYLQKRNSMFVYSEYIMDTLLRNGNESVSKNDYISMFETSSPPNSVFTSSEMWHYFLKRNLGY